MSYLEEMAAIRQQGRLSSPLPNHAAATLQNHGVMELDPT